MWCMYRWAYIIPEFVWWGIGWDLRCWTRHWWQPQQLHVLLALGCCRNVGSRKIHHWRIQWPGSEGRGQDPGARTNMRASSAPSVELALAACSCASFSSKSVLFSLERYYGEKNKKRKIYINKCIYVCASTLTISQQVTKWHEHFLVRKEKERVERFDSSRNSLTYVH